jgi:predicted acylesterase/phospholipase RssA
MAASTSNSTAPTPVPIQVVFQGGGAKLCLLMAVCDILKQYEAARRIAVTRVAGSSAGAIAAVMLASNKSMELYKSSIKLIGREYLAQMNVRQLVGAWRVYRGNAYFSDMHLERFFERLFCSDDGPRRVQELRCEPQLYFTDLYSLNARACAPDEAIPKALAKSCRFPFAFVGFNSGNTDVDGGLALNLPVDHLKRDESKNGSVIGIGFSTGFGDLGKSNLLSYTQQLFSAAIESGVARSELILGSNNVFRIDTGIGIFDFGLALNEGLDIHYKLVASQFRTWLDEWLKSFGPIVSSGSAIGVAGDGRAGTSFPAFDDARRLIRPQLSNVPLAPAIVRELDEQLRSAPSTHALSVSSYDIALFDSRGNFDKKYRSRNVMKFTVTRPMNVLQFDFQTGKVGTFSEINLGCAAVTSRGTSLPFASHVQELPVNDKDSQRFRIYFLFEHQLKPDDSGQPYIVDYQYEAPDPYPALGREPQYSIVARWGQADEMVLAVAVPREKFTKTPEHHDISTRTRDQLREMKCELENESLVPSEEFPLTEFITLMQLDQPPEKYFLAGRVVRNTKAGQAFGLVIE